MKILHIVAGLEFGGVAEVAVMYALHQQKLDCVVTIASVEGADSELMSTVRDAENAGVKLMRFTPSFFSSLFFSVGMVSGLGALIKDADVVHVHSNWTFPVWWGCRLALKNKKKLVMTSHGCLSPERLAHSKWKKKLVGWIDRYYLRRADVIHATCEAEALSINDFIDKASASQRLSCPSGAGLRDQTRLRRWFEGLGSARVLECASARVDDSLPVNYQSSTINRRSKIVIIPNGVDLDEFVGEIDKDFWRERFSEIGERKVFLALGRLHPLKGLDLLIKAVAELLKDKSDSHSTSHIPHSTEPGSSSTNNHQSSTAPEWVLIIAGPDEQGTLAKLKSQVRELKLDKHVVFAEAIPASERKDAIGSAHCLVLPSRHENFGLTVVEALACQVPVIATKGAPWEELLRPHSGRNCEGKRDEGEKQAAGRCGWWVDVSSGAIADALDEALCMSEEERAVMGENGRRLVEQKYQWKRIAKEMLEVYKQA